MCQGRLETAACAADLGMHDAEDGAALTGGEEE